MVNPGRKSLALILSQTHTHTHTKPPDPSEGAIMGAIKNAAP